MDIPTVTEIYGLFLHSKPRPGFFWNGQRYTLTKHIDQAQFNLAWKRGWEAGERSLPNVAHHYKAPLNEIYSFAYHRAPKLCTDRALILKAIKDAIFEELPF